MKFRIPNRQETFEIPDAWLVESNTLGFVATTPAYVFGSEPDWPTVLIPVAEIAAPVRNAGVTGLDSDRTVSLLRAIAYGQPVPSIIADQPPALDSYRYRVRDGYHRYYISVALGFTHLPLAVRPYFEFSSLDDETSPRRLG